MTMSNRMDEITKNDILKDIDSRTQRKSKGYYTFYKGVTRDYDVIFETPSQVTPGVTYIQKIKMREFKDIEGEEDLTVQEKVRLALSGDIEVSCTCPAYRWWGYEYIMTQLDANNGPDQNIFPKIRNPNLLGTVCKHLKVVLQVIGNNYTKIASDISKGKFV